MKQSKGYWKYGRFFMKCPSCDSILRFNYGDIKVNAETERAVDVGAFLRLSVGCKNPFCKWSKVEEMENDVYNYSRNSSF